MSLSSAQFGRLDTLLRGTSRSFYLSIRLLPGTLRPPVGVAYLLARATDTVADTAAVPAEVRLDTLDRLGRLIANGQSDPQLFQSLAEVGRWTPHPSEKALLARLGACLDAMEALAPEDQADVRKVLRHIVRGQGLDVQRFPDASRPRALPDASALHEYTYLVAGSVGEFWTDVCSRHLPEFANTDRREMRALGQSFGCALQLVNIVRDAGADLAAGRCYFPADELAAEGIDAGHILADPDGFLPVWHRWQDFASLGLEDGMSYAHAVGSRRVRAAVALPALLGRQTLSLLRGAGPSALRNAVKVPRSEVRRLLLRIALGLAGHGTLQREWDNRAQ